MTDNANSETKGARRFPWGHTGALVAWFALCGAFYVFFDSQQKPKVAVASGLDQARGEIVIPRSRDGHYYVAGSIQGHPVTFMVDTGATTVVVAERFARKAGLPAGRRTRFETAGGTVSGETVSGMTVEAAGIEVSGISVGVGLQMDDDVALLGQNFLRRVEMVQSGDQMILRIRAAAK
jgi:aspartyl protease family protein